MPHIVLTMNVNANLDKVSTIKFIHIHALAISIKVIILMEVNASTVEVYHPPVRLLILDVSPAIILKDFILMLITKSV